MEEINMAKLLLFADKDLGEYVVIQEDMEVPVEEFAEPGYALVTSIDIASDPYQFPTDCTLRPS